jgi:PAS domain S-box-containing protein
MDAKNQFIEKKLRQRDDWHLTDAVRHAQGRSDPFAAAVRATRMAMVITDPTQPDNPIVFANEAFQRLTGYDLEEIIGRNCRFLQGPNTDRDDISKVRQAIDAGDDIEIDLLNYRKDGSTFWNALYLSPVYANDNTIQFFFASQLDITERVEAQSFISKQKAAVEQEVRTRTSELEAALEAKTLLLHEVDHRVKNNLSMIGALLRLQTKTIDDPVLIKKLDAMLERLDALATIHRRLYQSEDITMFDVGAFLSNLVMDVVGASGRTEIEVITEIEPMHISSDRAAPLGLVLNEILTNAIKHGFSEGRDGTLTVVARREGDTATISISDDGAGMPSEVRSEGLGKTLISRLSRQLGARTTWTDAQPGTTVTISLPLGK